MPTSAFSRRVFLSGAGAAGVGLALAAPAGSAFASPAGTDDFATIRSQWATVVSGGAIDAADPAFAAALAALNTQTASFLSLLVAAPASQLFSDLPLGAKSSNVTGSFTRLQTLALAYVTPGTDYTGSDSVFAAVTAGLDYMTAGPYAPGVKPYGNWWDWQIGSSQPLVDTANLLYPALSATRIAAYCAAVDAFVPDPTKQLIIGHGYTTSTGANRLDECRAVIIRGAIAGDAAKVAQGVAGISPTLAFVTAGDGLHADGSWIQHTDIPYTGTYGAIWLGDLVKLMATLAGTSYQISDPNVANVFFAATKGFAPVVYNGLMLDCVRGRAVARSGETDYADGFAAVRDLLMLAPAAATPQLQEELKSVAKGWLQRSPYQLATSTSVPGIAYAEQVLTDSTVPAAPEPVGHTLFGAMDRAVHRRPGWALAVAMSSVRTAFYETDGSSNLTGWHTGAGMTYLYLDSDNTQYNDAFWPTVDPYRLPGVTASLLPLTNGEGGPYSGHHPANAWAGGATDGEYAALGQDLRGPWSTLVAKKAWFCLDDAIVCLGAGITCTDGTEVDSVIDNRNLGAAGTNRLLIDGVPQPGDAGWTRTVADARWAHLDGHAGYVFPQGITLTASREARTGSWSQINTTDLTTPLTRDYVTLSTNHGTDPADAAYAYILMPGARPWQVAARAYDPFYLRVLVNTADQQGIAVPSRGTTAVDFYAPGSVGPITASAPACVLIREHHDGTATVCVSDPARQATNLTVTWNRPVRGILTAPASLTSSSTGCSLQMTFGDLTGLAGATQKVTVRL